VGIIDSLSAGYRFSLRRLDLLLIPVLLDTLIWLAPRLSIAGLAARVTAFYNEVAAQAQLTGELAEMADANTTLFSELGRSFNLLTGLVSSSLMHMPSLASTASLPPSNQAIDLATFGSAFGIWVLLLVAGLFLGVVFLEQAAGALPLGAGEKAVGGGDFVRAVWRHFVRVLGFALLALVAMFALLVPVSVMMGLLMLVVPGLALLMWGIMMGLLFMGFLFLYFVTAAIVLDDLAVFAAIRSSVSLVRRRLLSVLGFVLLVFLIGTGIGFLLGGLADMQPLGTATAIVVNAFIGTGLAVGLLVFYRSQLLRAAQAVAGEPL
jgi:hypothetical protein